MKAWKISFWIVTTLLVISNLFWIYQLIDINVGKSYYQVSCDEYKANSDILDSTLHTYENINDLFAFLEKHEIEFETISKSDNENYIIIGSLAIPFHNTGEIIQDK